MGTFLQQWQSWVVVIEIVKILKPKILPIWLFKKNFANLWSLQWLITSSGILITFKLFFLVSSHRVGTGKNILSWLVRDIKSPRNKGFSLCWPEGEHYFWWIIFTQGQKSHSKHVPVSLSLIQKQHRNYLQTQVLIYWLWQLLSSCLPCHDNKVIEIEVESNWQTPRTIAKLAQVHFFLFIGFSLVYYIGI